jgi:hypothetical protein
MKIILILSLILLLSIVFAKKWGPTNDPKIMGKMKSKFSNFKTQGSTPVIPWSGKFTEI